MKDWYKFVREQKEHDLKQLIEEEKLNEPETRRFLDNAFRTKELKTTGIAIEKILPPMSRFRGGGKAKRKQTVIEKITKFFEKFFGLGLTETDNE